MSSLLHTTILCTASLMRSFANLGCLLITGMSSKGAERRHVITGIRKIPNIDIPIASVKSGRGAPVNTGRRKRGLHPGCHHRHRANVDIEGWTKSKRSASLLVY